MSGESIPWMPAWHTPPSEHLVEFLCDLDITPSALAQRCGMPRQKLVDLLLGGGRITEENAPLLSQGTGPSSEYWLRLQEMHDEAPMWRDDPEVASPSPERGGALPEHP